MKEHDVRQRVETFLKMSAVVEAMLVAALLGLACSDSGLKSTALDADVPRGGQTGSTISGGTTGGLGGMSGAGGSTEGTGGAVGTNAGCGVLCTPVVHLNPCGDGFLDPGEECDDGNRNNGDGCNFLCQIEANYECPNAGQPCTNMVACGNGRLTSDEICDDGNTVSGDGCSGDCQTIETGWQCPKPGRPCIQICGSFQLDGSVTCDAGNDQSGSCGDGVVAAGEECDCGDGTVPVPSGCPGANNDITYGGCKADCTWGPFCGDGLVQAPQEQCDLGKLNGSNDGAGGCTFGCLEPPYCGNGIIDPGEECDIGPFNGVRMDDHGNPSNSGYLLCDRNCRLPPGPD
jgi:cysteine-rich repeat protein